MIISAVSAGTFERESVVSGVITKGYRSMAVSSDGKHLAAGDSDGNLHIFNLHTSDYTCIQVWNHKQYFYNPYLLCIFLKLITQIGAILVGCP